MIRQHSYFDEAKKAIMLFQNAVPLVSILTDEEKESTLRILMDSEQNQNFHAVEYRRTEDITERILVSGIMSVASTDALGKKPDELEFSIMNIGQKTYFIVGAQNAKTLVGQLPVRKIAAKMDELKVEIFNGGNLPEDRWERKDFIVGGKKMQGYAIKVPGEGGDIRQAMVAGIVCNLATAKGLDHKYAEQSVFLPDSTIKTLLESEGVGIPVFRHFN